MSDDLIHLRFPDNYGRAWIELLESDLTEHARICYVAMTSFGRESRAGKEAIRRRMGVKSLSTVKAAQAELARTGWIKRLAMGGGLKPTEWDVYNKPHNGQLPLLGNETPGRTATGAYSAPGGAAERPTPGREAAPKQEYKHELKQEKRAGVHPDQDAFWTEAKATWASKHPGAELAWPARTMRDWQMHLTAELIRLGGPELGRRWKNCATDPWAKPSLRAFILDTDKWITARGPAGAAPGRAFNRPESDPERRPTGGTLE